VMCILFVIISIFLDQDCFWVFESATFTVGMDTWYPNSKSIQKCIWSISALPM